MSDSVRLTAHVSGDVQGVGYRVWVRRAARERGLAGSATNLPDGRVRVIAEGPRQSCELLLEALRGRATPGSVHAVDVAWHAAEGVSGFAVV